MPSISDSHQRIKAIDGLRAIAVLCVLIYHLFPKALPGGFVGVDIFFVISGYVVCGSLLKTPVQRFWTFASSFYARRVIRIYPALMVVLIAVGVLSRLFIPDSFLAGSSQKTGYAAFFGVSNFQLVLKADGYFAPTAEFNPYQHTWSLGVEEQFYFLFPLILFLCLKSKQTQNLVAARLGGLLLPLLFCLSLVFSIWETSYRHDSAYYLLPSRFWELALGAILCLAHTNARLIPKTAKGSSLLILCGLAGIALSLGLTQVNRFPFPWAIAPAMGTACCIAGLVTGHANIAAAILSSRPAAYIGRISYSLYLWHWPVLVLLRWTIGLESALSFLIAILATGVLAILSYHLIERPFQSLRSFQDQWTQFVVSHDRRSRENGKMLLALPTNVLLIAAGLGAVLVLSRKHVSISRSAKLPLSVTMRTSDNPWKPRSQGIAFQKLVAGEPDRIWSGKRLFVIGDSHASSYVEMLSQLRQRDGVSIYLHWASGIRIGSLVFPQRDEDRAAERSALEGLKRYAQPGDIVLLASLRVHRLGIQWKTYDLAQVIAQRDSEQAEIDRQTAVQEGKELIRQLEQMGLVVVIEAPKPVFLAPPFRCADWFNQMNPVGRQGFVMDRDFLLEHRSAAMRSIAEVREQFPNVQVWDPFWVLCTGTTCAAFEGDKPLFFDSDHLSSYGNQKLFPDFVNHIQTIWGSTSSTVAASPASEPMQR